MVSRCCPLMFISFRLRTLSDLGNTGFDSAGATLPISLRTLHKLIVKSTAPEIRAWRPEKATPNSSGRIIFSSSDEVIASSGSDVDKSRGDGNALHNSSGLKCSGRWSMRS